MGHDGDGPTRWADGDGPTAMVGARAMVGSDGPRRRWADGDGGSEDDGWERLAMTAMGHDGDGPRRRWATTAMVGTRPWLGARKGGGSEGGAMCDDWE
jgi:hypothetical protein